MSFEETFTTVVIIGGGFMVVCAAAHLFNLVINLFSGSGKGLRRW